MEKEKRRILSNEEILDLLKERRETGLSYPKLAAKYGISADMVYSYCKYEREGKIFDFLEKRNTKRVKQQSNIDKIFEYEDKHNPFIPNTKIRKFYAEELKVADNIELSSYAIKRDMHKLINFLVGDKFKKEYGRDFTIVDMYLTTNLTVRMLCDTYIGYLSAFEYNLIINFLNREIIRVDNQNLFYTFEYSATSTYLRYARPAEKRINEILNQEFFSSNPVSASKEDIYNAYQILLDLNEKYGVKYDEMSLYAILFAYLTGDTDSFYTIGEKYKKELDQRTTVRVRCIPTLTRRESNIKVRH